VAIGARAACESALWVAASSATTIRCRSARGAIRAATSSGDHRRDERVDGIGVGRAAQIAEAARPHANPGLGARRDREPGERCGETGDHHFSEVTSVVHGPLLNIHLHLRVRNLRLADGYRPHHVVILVIEDVAVRPLDEPELRREVQARTAERSCLQQITTRRHKPSSGAPHRARFAAALARSAIPMTPVSGVRSSWLIVVRNSVLTRRPTSSDARRFTRYTLLAINGRAATTSRVTRWPRTPLRRAR
jgi:hypothetical protein